MRVITYPQYTLLTALPNIFGKRRIKDGEMVQANKPETVIVYQDAEGKEPFTKWLNGLPLPICRRG